MIIFITADSDTASLYIRPGLYITSFRGFEALTNDFLKEVYSSLTGLYYQEDWDVGE